MTSSTQVFCKWKGLRLVCCWSLLCNAILHSWANSLRLHVILQEWIALYSAFLTINMKLLPSRLVLCTPYHFMQSLVCEVYACLAVTCHPHFWQYDQGLLHKSAQKVTMDRKILPLLLQGFKHATFLTSRCSNHWAIPTPLLEFSRYATKHVIMLWSKSKEFMVMHVPPSLVVLLVGSVWEVRYGGDEALQVKGYLLIVICFFMPTNPCR